MLHGPAELVHDGFPVLAFLPQDVAREGMLATLAQLREAGARIFTVEAGGEDSETMLAAAPSSSPWLAPVTMIHRFYRLAEAVARRLGRNPDAPRNLRKVTETV